MPFVHIIRDTQNPSSPPPAIGQHWINTETGQFFFSIGTDSVQDWIAESIQYAEYDSIGDFPAAGLDGVIYLSRENNHIYRWNVDEYIVISEGVTDHGQLSGIGTNSHAEIDIAISNSASHISSLNNPHQVTATQVGLGNVNNTSDLDKPISTATQTALNLKADSIDLSNHVGQNIAHGTTSAIVGISDSQTLTNKTINASNNSLSNISNSSIANNAAITLTKLAATTQSRALVSDLNGFISASSVTAEELAHLSGVTSSIQNQLTNKANTTDLTSHVSNLLNPHSVTAAQVGLGNVDNTSDLNKPISTATQTALNLKADSIDLSNHVGDTSNPHSVTAAQVGNTVAQWNANQLQTRAVDSSLPSDGQALAWSTTNNRWQPQTITAGVSSVFGRTGVVVAQNNDYTWAQIDKTISSIADITTRNHSDLTGIGTNSHADIDTAISNSASHIASTSNPHQVTATQVGLGNVDNTSDLDKPISTATQSALNLKISTTLNSANILVGNASNIASAVAISGHGSLTNSGVFSLTNNVIVNAHINTSAAISLTKLAATTASRVLVSDASGFISASSITAATLGFLDATSSIQTQLNNKENLIAAGTTSQYWRGDKQFVVHDVGSIVNQSGTTLMGRHAGGAGNGQEVSVGNGVEFSGSGIRRSALSGVIEAVAGSNTTTFSAATQALFDARVVGPATSTLNAIARYSDTTGKIIQDSSVLIDNSGRISVGGAAVANNAMLNIRGSDNLIESSSLIVRQNNNNISFNILNSGEVIVGNTLTRAVGSAGSLQVFPKLQVVADDGTASFLMSRSDNGAFPGRIYFAKARGTTSSPAAILSGDALGSFAFSGRGPENMREAVRIDVVAQSSPAPNIAGRIDFRVNTGSVEVPGTLFSVHGLTQQIGIGITNTTPTARLDVRGEGNTSATSGLLVRSLNNTTNLEVIDDGTIKLGKDTLGTIELGTSAIGAGSTRVKRLRIFPNSDSSAQLELIGDNAANNGLPALYLRDSPTGASGSNITFIGRGDATLPNINYFYLGAIKSGLVNANSMNFGILLSNTTKGRYEALAVLSSGLVQYDEFVSARTANYTIVSADKKTLFTNAGASGQVDFTLPTPVVGLHFKFYSNAAQVVRVIAGGTRVIRRGAQVTAAGGSVATTASLGNYFELVAVDTTTWVMIQSVENGAFTFT